MRLQCEVNPQIFICRSQGAALHAPDPLWIKCGCCDAALQCVPFDVGIAANSGGEQEAMVQLEDKFCVYINMFVSLIHCWRSTMDFFLRYNATISCESH